MDGIPSAARAWWSGHEPGSARERKHRLVDAVRSLMAAVVLLDAEEATSTEVAALRDELVQLSERLQAQPSLADRGGPVAGGPVDRQLTERGPISGLSNPLAAPVIPSIDAIDGDRIAAHVVFPSTYEGPKGYVHGGMVLAVFDEVLALAQVPSGSVGMTAEVKVRLLRPTPIDARIDFEGGVLDVQGRKIRTWARSLADGEVLADAEALCILSRTTT